jgi:hypothetical protein
MSLKPYLSWHSEPPATKIAVLFQLRGLDTVACHFIQPITVCYMTFRRYDWLLCTSHVTILMAPYYHSILPVGGSWSALALLFRHRRKTHGGAAVFAIVASGRLLRRLD